MTKDIVPPRIPLGRRFRRWLFRHLPVVVWMAAAAAAGWLYLHERPRSQAVATAEFAEVSVVSDVSARILRLAVLEGQSVRDGDLVATLDSRELDERIERTRAILDQLRSITTGSKEEIKLYELKLADHVREKDRYTLVARASGRIGNLPHHPGDWVNAGSEIAVIESGRPGRLTAYLTDSHYSSVVRGTRAALRPRSRKGVSVEGRVVKVAAHTEQVPERLHREAPTLAAWGRSVTIELDRSSDFSPGEIYDVHFLP